MTKERFLEILTHYLQNQATEEEEKFLYAYYNFFMADADVIALLNGREKTKLKLSMKAVINSRIGPEIRPVKRFLLWPFISSAAAIVFLVGTITSIFLYIFRMAIYTCNTIIYSPSDFSQ